MDLRGADVSLIIMLTSWRSLKRLPSSENLRMAVQQRALACQISNFLDTSWNPKFIRNQFHEALFKSYVLEDTAEHPDIPPYFKGDFFPAIKRINKSPLNVANLTLKQIYRLLLEEIIVLDDEEQQHGQQHPLE